ncbi:BtrH N-terminal domain-containing protein [Halopenitus sp. H-Gu1]|uniref:BtrH N-terminal domain-containing protein n=1 Tax=Halopenitus sp. H-Gu1 TaxID=3242697 RepID=UPI00359CD2C0
MELIEGYTHQSGVHCGAAALRNVAQYYGWNYSEGACFGIGGGPAFVLYEHPEKPWVTFRASSTWLERAFLERIGAPHSFRKGDDFQTAWENVTGHVDDDDPVLLFLDPAPLSYLPEEPDHLPHHVAVLIGYDDETVVLSDGALETRQEVSRATLEEAWTSDGFVPLDNEYLTVTRARTTEDGTDAAAAGLRQAATYMIEPLHVKRDARGPGEEGLPALRSFGDYLSAWADLPDPVRPVRAARRSIDEHGDGAAFRGLYAESLDELGQRTGLAHDLSDRMASVAEEWRTVAEILGDILEEDEPDPAHFEEAASLVGDIAEREEAIFESIADELGHVDEE